MTNPYQAYIRTDLETQPLPKLVSKAYERISFELKQAVVNMNEGNIKQKVEHIHRAMEILRTLRLGLDFDNGGEIAKNLDELYEFIEKQISLGNLKNDEKIFEDVFNILDTIKSGWDEIS